jgi:hypothetical protein
MTSGAARSLCGGARTREAVMPGSGNVLTFVAATDLQGARSLYEGQPGLIR